MTKLSMKILLIAPLFSFLYCNSDTKPIGFLSKDGNVGKEQSALAQIQNINSLAEYNGADVNLKVEDKDRGGDFSLIDDSKLEDDYGMIFPSKAGKSTHWVRKIAKDEPINLKWYGAKGDGVSHYKDDSAALTKAIKFIENKGGGKLYVPAATTFYAYNGLGILLPDNIEIYGDGDKSEIKNINPQFAANIYYLGVIFYTTTYGPNNFNGITRAPTFKVNNAKKGQSYVVLKDSYKKWAPGNIIGLGSNYFFKRNINYKARYSEFELNEVTKINGDTVYLKYPLTSNLRYVESQQNENEGKQATKNASRKKAPRNPENAAKRNERLMSQQDSSGYPVIVDVNASKTFNEKLNVHDRISKNIYLHHLKLSQADFNMITNAPYTYDKPPADVIALGGTFESKFDHLTLEGAGTFGGNLWNRCEISNITIYSQRKLFDLGYGSANSKLTNIKWIYKPTKITDKDVSLVYLNDGTHNIELGNISVTGKWSRGNIFQLAGGSHDIKVHDIIIDLPEYDSPNGRIMSIRDDNRDVYIYNVSFSNISIKLKQVGYLVKVDGVDVPNIQKNIKFNDISFSGTISQDSKNAISVNNTSDLELSNVNLPSGNIYLSNTSNSKIDGIKAPNSYVVYPNKSPKPNVNNSVYKGVKADQK